MDARAKDPADRVIGATALVEALARNQSGQPNSASEGDANHLVDRLGRSLPYSTVTDFARFRG
jgi:hypothetical protein